MSHFTGYASGLAADTTISGGLCVYVYVCIWLDLHVLSIAKPVGFHVLVGVEKDFISQTLHHCHTLHHLLLDTWTTQASNGIPSSTRSVI